MEQKIKSLLLFIGVIMSVVFSSCEDDQDENFELTGNVAQYFPSYCVNLTGTTIWGHDKYFHMVMELQFYFDPSEWGLKIDKVDYYIDNVYYKTETQSPYQIEYESWDWYVGAHNIKANITISGAKIETFVLECTKTLDNSSSQEKVLDV